MWAQSEIVIIKSNEDTRLDPARLCSFDAKWVRFIYTQCPVGDSCIWEVDADVGTFGSVSLFNGNMSGDTISFTFADSPKSGEVRVKMKSNPGSVSKTLSLVQIPQATRVSDITWDPPICENAEVEFKIEPIEADYDTKYLPGALNFRWTSLRAGDKEIYDGESKWVENVSQASDFTYSAKYTVSQFKGGTIVVTPYTCDGPSGNTYRTDQTRKTLEPFVVRKLYSNRYIYTLKLKEDPRPDDIEPSKWDKWEINSDDKTNEANSNKTICRDYSSTVQPNWNKDNGKEGYVYLGFGDRQTWLDVEKKDSLPEYYYTYEWGYDSEEMELAEDKMAEVFYKEQGFGKDSSRVIFRVLAGHEKDYEHTVSLTIRCPKCISRPGGNEDDYSYTTSI
ncbi:MAG: hypothetical protein K2I68_03610, partial [Bacteroidales bacterium]|nr:hypothetical protein [Bacteroidales bacterium]